MDYNTSKPQKVRALIAVKSPPYPSKNHRELVCTAGITSDGQWIRIVPVPYRYLKTAQQYQKFDWIELEVVKHDKDKRFETFRPVDLDRVKIAGKETDWNIRRKLLEPHIGKSLCEHVADFHKKATINKQYEANSLFFIKPYEIIDFIIEKSDSKWKPEWEQLFAQESLFAEMRRKPLDKIPFSFSYRFKCSPTCKGHKMKVEDWEIIELARNYLDDHKLLCEKVTEKYKDWMLSKRDPHFFIGSTLQFHKRKAKNPYIIIGVFYPPIVCQPALL